jgi:gliding motility-associated-like protein
MRTKKLTAGVIAIAIISLFSPVTAQPISIDAGPDQTICPPNCATLTATFTGGNGTSDYTVSAIPYNPDPFNAGTTVTLSDDAVSGALPIGFTFCFYGNNYTQFYIGSNGWISFSPGQATSFTSSSIPSALATVPKNCIMGPWQDWHPGIAGGPYIRYITQGVAPNRRLIVSFNQIPFFSCTSTLGTFQIIIYEDSNLIESHIASKPSCVQWAGGTAVHGIHNLAGNQAVVVPGRNSTVWTANNDSWSWVPNGNPTIEWYDGGTLVGTGPTITVCPTSTTVYEARLINCNTILASDQVTVNVGLTATIHTNFINPSCTVGNNGVAWVDSVGGAIGPFAYSWNTIPPTPADSAFGLIAGSYTVTVADVNGCTTQASVTLTDQGTLQTGIVFNYPVNCHGDASGQFQVTGLLGTAPYQYALGTDTSQTGVFSNLAAGTYDSYVIDSEGCVALQQVTITEPLNPLNLNLNSFSDITCNGLNNGQFVLAAIGGTPPYLYSNTFQTNNTGIFNNQPPGNYQLSVTDNNGCFTILNQSLSEPSPLIAAIDNFSHLACHGVNTGSASVLVSGGTPPYNYTWNSAPPQFTPQATNLFAGPAQVSINDNNNCQTTAVVDLIEPQPLLVLTSPDNFICQGNSTVLTAFGTGGTGNITYQWSNGMLDDTISVSPAITTTYTITITDQSNCTNSQDIEITVFENPVPIFAANVLEGCVPLCVDFIDLTPAPGGSAIVAQQWDFGDQRQGTGGLIEHCYRKDGLMDVSLTIVTDKGCIRSTTFNDYINIYPMPTANFITEQSSANIFNPDYQFINTSVNGIEYNWNFGDGSAISYEFSPAHSYKDTGDFYVRLMIVSEKGCMDTLTKIIRIEPYYTFFIPNAFTPNGDGLNDEFVIRGEYMAQSSMSIFDRWGKVIYSQSSTGERISWDGRNVPNGVYIYSVQIKDTLGNDHKYNGQVTLIR